MCWVERLDALRCRSLAQLLEVALGDESFHVSLSNVKLAVLGQSDGTVQGCQKLISAKPDALGLPVFSLDFACVFQHPHVDEQVSWRLEAAGKIDIGPLTFVCRQQIAELPHVVLLLRAETAGPRVARARGGPTRGRSSPFPKLLPRQVNHVRAAPDQFFELVGPRLVVREQAPLVPSHRKVVDKERARRCLVSGGIEGPLEGLEKTGDIAV